MQAEAQEDWILRVFAARAGSELERLHAEERLRESEARARTLLESHFDGVVLVVDGRIVYANRALWQLAGFPSAEALVAPHRSVGDFGTVAGLELGLGYAVSSAVRLEALVTYRPRFTFDGRANFLDPDRRQSVSADLAALSGILAAYVDLPGLGCVRSARSPSAPKESPGQCRITASRKNPPT